MIETIQLFIKSSQTITEICKHLLVFDIHHFTYLKQYNDGGRIALSNKPQWIEDYYNLELFKSSLFENKPSSYQSKFEVWFGDYDLEVYRYGKQCYNTGHSITITETHKEFCEFFLFSTTPDNHKAINYLVSNIDILYHFIAFFKDKSCLLLKKLTPYKIINYPFTQEINVEQDNNTHFKDMDEKKRLFYYKTPIHKYMIESNHFPKVKLTQRELDCITYLLENKTAEETASFMNISRRTVESYFENLKTKLNCNSKNELYTKMKNYRALHALRYPINLLSQNK